MPPSGDIYLPPNPGVLLPSQDLACQRSESVRGEQEFQSTLQSTGQYSQIKVNRGPG